MCVRYGDYARSGIQEDALWVNQFKLNYKIYGSYLFMLYSTCSVLLFRRSYSLVNTSFPDLFTVAAMKLFIHLRRPSSLSRICLGGE